MLGQEAGRQGQHGQECEGEGLGALDAAEQDQTDAFVEPRFGDPHRHDQNAKDEKDRVGHVGLGDLFHGQDREKIEQDAHQDIRGAQRQGFGAPQEGRQEEDAHR